MINRFNVLLIAISLILGLMVIFYLKSNFKRDDLSSEQYEYQYDLAVMNKSFKRDLERSVILYKSFEKYFLGAEKIPFVMVIPVIDWDLFINRFQDLKEHEEIRGVPQFITEEEVFERCNEPGLSMEGWLSQQVVKLCFGSTRIAKNYIMIDSDNYFVKEFDPKVLFKNGVLKTIAWKLPNSRIEGDKTSMLNGFISPILRNNGHQITTHDMHIFIKDFFGNKKQDFYAFVLSPFLFNSDALARMKKFIDKKGGYKISTLIRLMPYEMQWYGEYVLQHEDFIKTGGIMKLINSPDECHPEDPGPGYYGFWFQSVIYDYVNNGPSKDSDQLIYKRPAHCDNK